MRYDFVQVFGSFELCFVLLTQFLLFCKRKWKRKIINFNLLFYMLEYLFRDANNFSLKYEKKKKEEIVDRYRSLRNTSTFSFIPLLSNEHSYCLLFALPQLEIFPHFDFLLFLVFISFCFAIELFTTEMLATFLQDIRMMLAFLWYLLSKAFYELLLKETLLMIFPFLWDRFAASWRFIFS